MAAGPVLRHDARSFVLLDPDREWVFAADPLGRVGWIHTPQTVYRRSRFNRWYTVKRGRWAYLESVEEAAIAHAVESWTPLWERTRSGILRSGKRVDSNERASTGILDQWIERFMDFHREDARRFGSIYQNIPILPPDAYQSLYTQVSVGCPWNRCLFCGFYRDRTYRVRGEEDLFQHLASVRSYWEGALGSRFGLFLGDANAVAIPADVLLGRCRMLREVFPEPQFRNLSSFADFFTAGKREGTDFKRLRTEGLRRICLGIESGDPDLMEEVHKPVRAQEVIRVAHDARSAGLELSVIFIVGLGGTRYRDSHFRNSMELLSKLPLARPDRLYLSPLVAESGLGYFDTAQESDWGYLTEESMDVEMNRWAEALRELLPNLAVSLYNIRQFAY